MTSKAGSVRIPAPLGVLELENPSECRNKRRHDILLPILSNEACHETLSYSFDEIINT